jgi:hypothetical protein
VNVELIDLDSKIPNLALMKISAYCKKQGHKITMVHGAQLSRQLFSPDIHYISCVFSWNRDLAVNTAKQLDGTVFLGGSGIELTSKLPTNIETCQPDYSIYPDCDYAIGFISRGCIRKCPWCIVPKKEGMLWRESTAREIVGNRRKAIFLDNNFLALPDYQSDLIWLAKNKIFIDFNQGLDARLITDESAKHLAKCKYKYIRLSLDSNGMVKHLEKAIAKLTQAGVARHAIRVYTLIGFNGLQSDIETLLKLFQWKVQPFPMGYIDEDGYEPAREWDRNLYRKYKRLILRMPNSKSVISSFKEELCHEQKNQQPKWE